MNAFSFPPWTTAQLVPPAIVGVSVAIISYLIQARKNRRSFYSPSQDRLFVDPPASSPVSPKIVSKTVMSADGSKRLVVFERSDHTFGFCSQDQLGGEDPRSVRFIWSEGGVYDSIETAEREAAVERAWLRSAAPLPN